MTAGLLTVRVRTEQDVVLARQRARDIAERLGFDPQDQTRIATGVSEIARNAFRYAAGGRVVFSVGGGNELRIEVIDEGPGVADLAAVLDGRYRSRTGMGLGIVGTRRLMDSFAIESEPGRTIVAMSKRLPARSRGLRAAEVAALAMELVQRPARDAMSEVQEQNQELLRTLDELRARQEELAELNRELEDTNRGVVALYAELDEKAESLQRANELKTRFLSNMSHEFRTPLNSILSLTRILLERIDGSLNAEQDKQVHYIRRSAEELSELVNDLLDIAKVEAGKIVVRPTRFEVRELFSGLRGMLRPLLAANTSLTLVFDEPEDIPTLQTDDGKVSQILRNFISNALKYTERGEVRVSARREGDRVRFSVSDTGIGIAPEDRRRIFEEFVQIEGPHQRPTKGTGLGLPLSRKLAELLGGEIEVESELGVGSTFSALIPIVYAGSALHVPAAEAAAPDPTRHQVLIVEDSAETLFEYEKLLKGTGFQVLPARTLADARRVLSEVRPVAIVLDVLLQDESTWDLLEELKGDPSRRDIPIVVITVVDNEQKAMALGADAFAVKPVDRRWLVKQLNTYARRLRTDRVLAIDDDEVGRYVLRGLLADTRFAVSEASGGVDGLERARAERPWAIILDLGMPDLSGREVLRRLKSDPETSDIPVIVYTAQPPEIVVGMEGPVALVNKEAPDRDSAVAAIRAALRQAYRARSEADAALRR